MFDVAIIGAGPAGTAAAYDLLEKRMKVLLLDKYEFPRKKACAGGITPKGYNLFRYDISSVVKRECSIVKINPLIGQPFLIKNANTLCYMTKREDLDLFSLNKVMEKGVDFRVVEKIQSIEELSSHVEIKVDSKCFKALYLIGADGSNSAVRRFVSRSSFWKKQFAIEADVEVDRPDKYQMEFDFSQSKNGYYWIFPRDDHVNIGIYSLYSNAGMRVRQLFKFAENRLCSTGLEAIKGYPICTGGFKYRSDFKRILLAGDAAGLAEPLLGEGIYFAVKSGQDAAGAILEAKDQSVSASVIYLGKIKKIQSDLRVHGLISGFFYRFPKISLKILSFPPVHRRFAKGYVRGETIPQILSCQSTFEKNI